MTAGEVEAALADLGRRLDDLAAQTLAGQSRAAAGTAQQLESLRARMGRLETLPAELERVAGATTVAQQATVETLRAVIERLARSTESLQQATLDTLRAEMERMGAATAARLAVVESLPADVQGVYRELDRLAELTAGRDADLARLGERQRPLEAAVLELRSELEQVARETAVAQQSALAAAAQRMDGLATRLAEVEPVQLDVQSVRRELERVVEEVSVAQQAALSAAGEQFSAQARLRALESLPATVESLQRELIRLSKDAEATSEAALAAVGERAAPIEEAQEVARHDLDRLAAGGAATAERMADVESHLAALDPVSEVVGRQAGELERVAAEIATARAEAADRARSLEERLAALESLPADVQGVYRELDKVAEITAGRAAELANVVGPTGMLRHELDQLRGEITRVASEVVTGGEMESVSTRLAGLEQLRADVDALTQEIDRVVQLSTTHDVALAQVAGRTTPLEAAVDDLRRDLDRAAADVAGRVGALESLPGDVEAVRARLAAVAGRVDEAAGRAGPVEAAVADLSARLDQAVDEMATLHRDTLAAASEHVTSLTERIRPLQALPGDVDRLAERVRVATEATAAEVADRTSPLDAGLEALRAGLAVVTADVAAIRKAAQAPAAFQLKAVEKQLRQLEPLTGDLAAQQEALAVVGDQVADLEAKLHTLEALPADIEGVYAALYQVADEVRTARRDEALA